MKAELVRKFGEFLHLAGRRVATLTILCSRPCIYEPPCPTRFPSVQFYCPTCFARWSESLQEQACLFCGCTEARACPGGCSWAGPYLCSKCWARGLSEPMDRVSDLIIPT